MYNGVELEKIHESYEQIPQIIQIKSLRKFTVPCIICDISLFPTERQKKNRGKKSGNKEFMKSIKLDRRLTIRNIRKERRQLKEHVEKRQ